MMWSMMTMMILTNNAFSDYEGDNGQYEGRLICFDGYYVYHFDCVDKVGALNVNNDGNGNNDDDNDDDTNLHLKKGRDGSSPFEKEVLPEAEPQLAPKPNGHGIVWALKIQIQIPPKPNSDCIV